MAKQRLSIFISGKGTNAINLINSFKSSSEFEIVCVLSTKENELVENVCLSETINYELVVSKTLITEYLIDFCDKNSFDWIILAGFLKKIPVEIIQKFPNRIINLHPSLLPKFGGKGMYGMNVHRAVIAAKEPKSGITIHFVNEEFDKGEIIAQFETNIALGETEESLAKKIHDLEITFFPKVLKEIITQ
jgi:phosphoribosylglycinamide formyltransferase-1